ncbi:MAG: elongation factor Ts [Clostridia bacterium]|nr:elongation factor Ts [Clostridia bacterium]MBQ4609233.1 elongation factor Ts [Clostridia bacterium]MBQ7051417.1 elongation factor Ts [Clostridia bacterium]
MAAITSALVKELRERTGAGMMDCKKALMACDGDMDKAIDFLREKGLAAAAKKAGRIAAEGLVHCYVCPECGVGVVIEVNCETDFVANTDNFKQLCVDYAKHVAVKNPASVEEMLAQPFYADESKTVNDLIGEATASIGEKISLRRFARFEPANGMVDTYIHMGGRIGVMVEIACDNITDEVKAMSHDLTMHIAAANPQFVRRSEVPSDNLEKEREVLTQQALNEGKPAKIVERMVEGRIEKYYKEVCLLEQPFVKDPDMSVTKMLAGKCDVVRFVRFERGEGLEKRVNDLAADIAAEQAKMKK